MKCAMPLGPRGGKSGQRPFFRSSQATAAKRGDARRRRRRGSPAWLRAMPRGSQQSNPGNAGRLPKYVAGPQPERVR